MNRAETSLHYAQACQKVIAQHTKDYKAACELLKDIDLPEQLHPMLRRILPLAWDIVDSYREEEENLRFWNLIRTTITNFLKFNWEQTTWDLTAIYGIYEGKTLHHTFSLVIRRQSDTITFESGEQRLITAAQSASESIEQQTDEWFIYNLAQLLPKQADELVLQNYNVVEVTVNDYFDW